MGKHSPIQQPVIIPFFHAVDNLVNHNPQISTTESKKGTINVPLQFGIDDLYTLSDVGTQRLCNQHIQHII